MVPNSNMLLVIARKIRTFLSQSPRFYLWLVPAWLLLGLSRAAILVFPFKRIAGWLGTHNGLAPRTPLISQEQERRARIIGRTIRVAAKYTPWTSNCFPQAITARLLLGVHSIPCAVFFGLARNPADSDLEAHAWVVSGRLSVTGGRSFDRFTSVGCFVSGI